MKLPRRANRPVVAGAGTAADDDEIDPVRLRWLLATLAAAAFVVFFQAFMVAPLIPRLAQIFGSSTGAVGLAVPAYLIPYGLMTLLWGPLSDRLGRRPIIVGSLAAFAVLTALTSLARTSDSFVWARVVTALGASGIVPIALALVGDLFPYRQRGRALSLFFAAMAGGIAFGSSAGALLEPLIGWQGLFLGVAGVAALLFVPLHALRGAFRAPPAGPRPRPTVVARNYLNLLADRRARRTYGYVLFNAVLHSGIYTWLGLYFARRYHLGETGIGLAVLGYGVPGFVVGPLIGRLADRRGRRALIAAGVAIAGIAALLLAAHLPLVAAAVAVAMLSLGYDLTQPLLAGIVTTLSERRGQAMALNVFTLFVGFGIGSLVFQTALNAGFSAALLIFGGAALLASALAAAVFRTENATHEGNQ